MGASGANNYAARIQKAVESSRESTTTESLNRKCVILSSNPSTVHIIRAVLVLDPPYPSSRTFSSSSTMDLIFSKDSPQNATLSLPTGQPVYELSTTDRWFHHKPTTIKKFQPGSAVPQDIGLVEIHSLHKNVVQILGRDVLPKSAGMFKRGRTFTSSNGQQYTWKRKSDAALLTDKFDHNMAIYETRHSNTFSSKDPTPGKLSIAPEALGIADEIIGTFAYVEQAERQARRGVAASGAGAASSGAVAC